MNEPKKKVESGAAGKPGESTAEKQSVTLNAAGMADLLKSEFAAGSETPEATAAHEIPAEEVSGVATNEGDEVDGAAGETPAAGEEAGDGTVAQPEAAAGTEAQLSEAEAAALHDWQETGGALPEPLQKLVEKRIGKLTGARDAEKARAEKAEAEAATLRAEVQQLKDDPKRPAVATVPAMLDEKAINQISATAEKFMDEVQNYLDDTATDDERTRVERYMASERLDANGLKRRVREVNRYVTSELPAQKAAVQQFRAQEAAIEPVAKELFGWLEDKAHPEYQRAQSVLQLMPELRQRTPAHKVALGTYVMGLKVTDALKAAGVTGDALKALEPVLARAFPPKGATSTATSKPAKTPPPKPPGGGSSASATAKPKEGDAASANFNKSPNRQTATEMARAALRDL